MENNLLAPNPKRHVLSSADFNKNVTSKPENQSEDDLIWKFNKACNFFLAYSVIAGKQDLDLFKWYYNKQAFLATVREDLPLYDLRRLALNITKWADRLTDKINDIERDFENGEVDSDYYQYEPDSYTVARYDGEPEEIGGYSHTPDFLELENTEKQLRELFDGMVEANLVADDFEAELA